MLRRNSISICHRSIHTRNKALQKIPTKAEIDVKFNFTKHSNTINLINKDISSYWNKTVTLQGWIDKKPKKLGKNIAFATLRDFEGNFTQIISKDESIVEKLQRSQIEDCISITGKITERFSKENEDNEMRWDLNIEELNTLNSSDILTSQLESLKTLPNEFPQQYRYLQLRLPYYQKALKTRSKTSNLIRNHLINDLNFTEIETPLLFKSTPEGAREFLVPTRKNSMFYALPQSPQQYKQLLMASGVKNYFQIAKCFRDEDLRSDRQPEFTQVDLEMSFAKSRDVQDVIESVVSKVFKEVGQNEVLTLNENGGAVKGPFIHLEYDEVISKYGIDKPDLRSNLKIENISEFVKNPINKEFPITEVLVLKNAFNGKANLPKTLFNDLEYKNRKPTIVPIKTDDDITNWMNKIPFELINVKKLQSQLQLSQGDVIAFSTRSNISYENPTPLGRFRQLAIQEFPSQWRRCKEDENIAIWVENFPLFNPIEIETNSKQDYPQYDYTKFESTHHPFTMVNLNDYESLFSDPLAVNGDHYDLVINGMEIGGGSRRIHDSSIQKYILKEILGINNYNELFGHLIKALELGCPPHAGFAIGFDRLMTILINTNTIRDVIAFPKTSNGSDLVVNSPSDVDNATLKQYFVQKL